MSLRSVDRHEKKRVNKKKKREGCVVALSKIIHVTFLLARIVCTLVTTGIVWLCVSSWYYWPGPGWTSVELNQDINVSRGYQELNWNQKTETGTTGTCN